MSKPMTKNQIATIKANANGNETVLALLAEVERLQRLAKPSRKPKTRKVSNENCSQNAKGCRCRITENACKAFDYYEGRQG